MGRMTMAAMLSAAALAAAGCATIETGPPQDVAGRWSGRCSNCPVRAFNLVLIQEGDRLTGTLQASGRTGLGENEMPLLDGKVSGWTVTFQVKGADGIPLDAELRVSADGQAMEGQGRHRAAFGLTFTRTRR